MEEYKKGTIPRLLSYISFDYLYFRQNSFNFFIIVFDRFLLLFFSLWVLFLKINN